MLRSLRISQKFFCCCCFAADFVVVVFIVVGGGFCDLYYFLVKLVSSRFSYSYFICNFFWGGNEGKLSFQNKLDIDDERPGGMTTATDVKCIRIEAGFFHEARVGCDIEYLQAPAFEPRYQTAVQCETLGGDIRQVLSKEVRLNTFSRVSFDVKSTGSVLAQFNVNILLGLQACWDYSFTMVQVSHVVLVSSKFDWVACHCYGSRGVFRCVF